MHEGSEAMTHACESPTPPQVEVTSLDSQASGPLFFQSYGRRRSVLPREVMSPTTYSEGPVCWRLGFCGLLARLE